MYSFLIALQYIGIAVLFVELIYILNQRPSVSQLLLVIFVISVMINLTAYLLEMKATTPDAAMLAVKFCYMGKVFIPFSMFLFIMHYCKIRIPKKVTIGLALCHILIAALVLTCEYHQLFYTSISYTNEGLFPHLVLGHGIFYNLYLGVLGVYTLLVPFFCIRTYCRTSNEQKRRQFFYLFAFLIIADAGLVLFLTGVTHGYDTTALGYVVASVLLLFSLFRHNLFDALTLAKDYVIDNLADALIVLDDSGSLVYTNHPAERLYPSLKNTPADDSVISELDRYIADNQKLHREDRIYSVTNRTIDHDGSRRGTMYLLTDVTDDYNYTARLQRDVALKTKELVRIQHSVIASFANMVEARDGVTGLHIKRTSAYVAIVAHAMQESGIYTELLTDDVVSIISDAAPLHDIGKISIPDAILTKPGRLTDDEFAVIKMHPEMGAHIIDESLSALEEPQYLQVARDMAYCHHEKWDGSGYPCGLAGDEIPLCARIMAIADVYDALRSKRSYKEPFSKEKALSIIEESAGSHFDPAIVAVFVANIHKIEQI